MAGHAKQTIEEQDLINKPMKHFSIIECSAPFKQLYSELIEMKKRSEEMQTLRAGCSKAESKIFAPPQTPFPGA